MASLGARPGSGIEELPGCLDVLSDVRRIPAEVESDSPAALVGDDRDVALVRVVLGEEDVVVARDVVLGHWGRLGPDPTAPPAAPSAPPFPSPFSLTVGRPSPLPKMTWAPTSAKSSGSSPAAR